MKQSFGNEAQERELAAFDAMGGRALSAFADRMNDVRANEGGHIGYGGCQGKAYKELSGLLDALSAKGQFTTDELEEMIEAAELAIGEGQSIFYRYGLHDAFQLMLEAATYARSIDHDTEDSTAAISRMLIRLLVGTVPMMGV